MIGPTVTLTNDQMGERSFKVQNKGQRNLGQEYSKNQFYIKYLLKNYYKKIFFDNLEIELFNNL